MSTLDTLELTLAGQGDHALIDAWRGAWAMATVPGVPEHLLDILGTTMDLVEAELCARGMTSADFDELAALGQ